MVKRQKIEYTTLKVEDVKNGHYNNCKIVEVTGDVSTKHGVKTVLNLEFNKKQYSVFLNAPSQNALIDAFGDDDEYWIGKNVNLSIYSGKETKNQECILVQKA